MDLWLYTMELFIKPLTEINALDQTEVMNGMTVVKIMEGLGMLSEIANHTMI